MVWNSIEEKLNNCVIFVVKYYKDDAESLYTQIVQHVGTSEFGTNIIAKQNNSKHGRCYYLELKGNVLTESHEQTKS